MASSFESQHPLYSSKQADWTLLDDAYEGESRVKSKGDLYLPVTSGQLALGMGQASSSSASGGGVRKPGQILYDAYLRRAIFPDVVRATVQALVGLMVREPWQIKVPTAMESILEAATERGEAMPALVDKILERVLHKGRCGLLVDVDEDRDEPYLVTYDALSVLNWDDTALESKTQRDLRMVLLDESGFERSKGTLEWNSQKKFRLLSMGSGEADEDGEYTVQVEREGEVGDSINPSIQGKKAEQIPFVFINSTDLVPEPGEVPLIGLGRLAMAIYRGEADYRQSLFMQGQDTLVLKGVANPNADDVPRPEDHVSKEDQLKATGSQVVVGAGAIIYLPDTEMDAKFIGVESKGIEEQREALENDYERASQFGMTLLTSGSAAEAEGTLRVRVAGRTASLASIAKTAAAGLEQALKMAAEWRGANPDEVSVKPNLDFIDDPMLPEDLMKLVQSKLQGMPLSWRTIHAQAQRRGLTDMTLEDELEEIDGEPDLGLGIGEEDPEQDPTRGEPDNNQGGDDDE